MKTKILQMLCYQSLLLLFSFSTAIAQTTLSNNVAFTIQNQKGGELTAPSPLLNWPKLCVKAQCVGATCGSPCTVDQIYDVNQITNILQGREIVMVPKTMQQVNVQRKIYVPETGQIDSDSFIRYLDTFSNPTGNSITISIELGSITEASNNNAISAIIGPNGTQVWRTSSDDSNIDLTDRWILFDDANAFGGNPSTTLFMYGAGATSKPNRMQSINLGTSVGFRWDFDRITIPAGQSVSIITLLTVEAQRTAGLEEIDNLLKLKSADATFGLSNTQRNEVVNADINASNACPIADIGGAYLGEEGSVIQLTAVKSFDAENAPLTYKWDLDGDANSIFDDAEGANASILVPQNQLYLIRLQVTDAGGKTDVDQAFINVSNATPSILNVATDSPIFEGSRLNVITSAQDAGTQDILTYEYDWLGDGNFVLGNPQSSFRYIADGTYQAKVKVRDQDNGVAIYPFEVLVQNKAPTIQQVIANNPSPEGSNIRFVVQAFDAGQDPIQYGFDYDFDSIIDQQSNTGEGNHTFEQDDNYSVGIYAFDQQNAVDYRTYNVAVLNAPPTIQSITLSGDPKEGEPIELFVDASDPGIFDRLTYGFDLDENPGFEIVQDSPRLIYTFPDNGIFVIRAQVLDEDFASASKEIVVDVLNQKPFGSLRFEGNVREGVIASADQGVTFDVYADVLDPSDIDTLSLNFSWDLNNDGIYERIDAGKRQSIRFDREGRYLIRAIARDKDLGEQIFEREIAIAGRLPQIQSLEILTQPPYVEGQIIRVRLNATDPDQLQYQFDFNGDGTAETAFQNQATTQFTYVDDGSYEIIAMVKDETGMVEIRQNITIENDVPDVELNVGNQVGEGENLELKVIVHDQGQDQISFEWHYANLSGQLDLTPEREASFFIPTQDDGFIEIRGVATDDEGAQSQEVSIRALIQNRPPFFPEGFAPLPATEGVAYNRVLPAQDPSPSDRLTFGLINPPQGISIDPAFGVVYWTPTYEDFQRSPIELNVTVSDDDGGTLNQMLQIEVLPRDEDEDGLPDRYEEDSCQLNVNCLSNTNPDDALQDADLDGRTALEEYRDQTNPFEYEGPAQPSIIAPSDNARLLETPNLIVSKVSSNLESVQPIEIEFAIYTDETLMQVFVQSPAQAQLEGIDQVSWSLLGQGLGEDALYYWRARSRMKLFEANAELGVEARFVYSAWTDAYSFRINANNAPPDVPVLLLPSNQSFVDQLKPNFQFNLVTDQDGDLVDYVLRIYRRTELGAEVDSAARIVVDTTVENTFYQFTPEENLQENTTYEWEVVAIDEFGAQSAPSERWSFTIDQNNEAPTDPIILYPEEGSRVTTSAQPTFKATGCVDPEGQAVKYFFQLQQRGNDEILAQSEGISADPEIANWEVPNPLAEDLDYVLTIYCSDDRSDSMAVSRTFFFTFKDNAPPAPTLLSPGNGESVSKDAAILVWSKVEDPERAKVTYEVNYCDPQGNCSSSDQLSKVSFSIGELIPPNQAYQWRVRAFDETGNASDYSDSRTIIILGKDKPASSGCQSTKQKTELIWLLMGIFGALACIRRVKFSS